MCCQVFTHLGTEPKVSVAEGEKRCAWGGGEAIELELLNCEFSDRYSILIYK